MALFYCVRNKGRAPMKTIPLPSKEMLESLLTYEPETGKLFWKSRTESMFKDGKQSAKHNANIWNSTNAGKEAFGTKLPNGHHYSSIHAKKYLAHRIIWKLVYGSDPEVLDHIDGNPSNNRIENLRNVSQAINSRNSVLGRNNTSGYIGVTRHKATGKWEAKMMVNRKTIFLGLYHTAEEASKARLAAGAVNGFHENHGRLPAAQHPSIS